MKIRFPIWLACLLAAAFMIPPDTVSAQDRRPSRPDTRPTTRPTSRPPTRPDSRPDNRPTDRQKERRDEEKESDRARQRAADERDRRGLPEHRPGRREQELREALARRERIIQERRAADRRDLARWQRERARRAEASRRATYARWGRAVATPEGRVEFELYSKRKARLNRIRDIGVQRNDNDLVKRVDAVILLENSRHANAVTLLVAKVK